MAPPMPASATIGTAAIASHFACLVIGSGGAG
jgi:hypothetical protein